MRINDLVFNDVTTFGIMAYSSLIIHELSHLTAMRALFTNIDPYLACHYTYCKTAWNGEAIIRPEVSISQETGYGIVSLAGPVTDLIQIALSSVIALNLRRSNSNLAKIFGMHAFALAANSYLPSILPSEITGIGPLETDYSKIEFYLGFSERIQRAIAGALVCATLKFAAWEF